MRSPGLAIDAQNHHLPGLGISGEASGPVDVSLSRHGCLNSPARWTEAGQSLRRNSLRTASTSRAFNSTFAGRLRRLQRGQNVDRDEDDLALRTGSGDLGEGRRGWSGASSQQEKVAHAHSDKVRILFGS